MTNERFDRNIRFFGEEGQDRLAASHVVIVGIGGLGSHVVQQLALLGIGRLTLIDKEELDITNLNRYVGVRQNDPLPGTLKVNLGYRLLKEINSGIDVYPMPLSFMSEKAMDAIIKSDYVFGCLDCQIDIAEAQSDLLSLDVRRNRDAIYGIERDALGVMGPSVVSINGVVASMAVTEFMLGVTGIRLPKRLLTYLGHMGIVTSTKEEPAPDCYYCKGIRGKRDKADIKRYIRAGITL
jgi:hypothetical protein